jgi:hypothetical protein
LTINGVTFGRCARHVTNFFATVADTCTTLLSLTTMSASYKCVYCRKTLPTLKGLQSHITQSKSCRDALQRITEKWSPTKKSRDEDLEISDTSEPMDQDEPMLFNPLQTNVDSNQYDPTSLSANNHDHHDRRARVEEVEDKEAGTQSCWIKDYLRPAGTPGELVQSYFEMAREEQKKNGDSPWAPFKDEEEWELAQWLITNVGQNATDKYLKLPIVSPFAPKMKIKS